MLKMYCVTQTFTEVAELLQLLQWRERAKKQSCPSTRVQCSMCPQQASVPLVLLDCTHCPSTWCVPFVSLVPPHFFSFYPPRPLPLILPDMKHSFIGNTNKVFLPLLHGSSCDSCSIKWLWRQQQQHKQLTCVINSIQAATQKVKEKEAHQPLQTPETCLPPPTKLIYFFFRLKRRKLNIKSVFYITGGENEPLTLH